MGLTAMPHSVGALVGPLRDAKVKTVHTVRHPDNVGGILIGLGHNCSRRGGVGGVVVNASNDLQGVVGTHGEAAIINHCRANHNGLVALTVVLHPSLGCRLCSIHAAKSSGPVVTAGE